MEDSRAACHDRCFFCVVVFGFGPFFRYVAPTVLRVSITVPARIAISQRLKFLQFPKGRLTSVDESKPGQIYKANMAKLQSQLQNMVLRIPTYI